MAKFSYSAYDANGKLRKGIIEADDEQAATIQLKAQALSLTSLTTIGGAQKSKAAGAGAGSLFGMPKLPKKQLCTATRQLATLLEAGLPLVRALRTLQRQAKGVQPAMYKVMCSLADSVEGGSTFSEALAIHPKSFDKLYVSMVRAGEASGAMEVVLNRLAEFMEKAQRIAGKVKSAMVYPISVLVMALGITAGLMIFIIPKFGAMFEEMLPGETLPGITQFVINCSYALKDHFLTVFLCAVGIIIVFKLFLKTKIGTYLWDLMCIKIPKISGLVIKNICARFSRTLGTLMGSGVAILSALMIVRDTAGNEIFARAIDTVHDAVKEGEGMTKPLMKSGIFPLMLCSMIEVGEETGALPDMLDRVANVYEEEVDRAVEALTSLIEPLMIMFLAVVIGTIVIALFAPMVKMIDKLGG